MLVVGSRSVSVPHASVPMPPRSFDRLQRSFSTWQSPPFLLAESRNVYKYAYCCCPSSLICPLSPSPPPTPFSSKRWGRPPPAPSAPWTRGRAATTSWRGPTDARSGRSQRRCVMGWDNANGVCMVGMDLGDHKGGAVCRCSAPQIRGVASILSVSAVDAARSNEAPFVWTQLPHSKAHVSGMHVHPAPPPLPPSPDPRGAGPGSHR